MHAVLTITCLLTGQYLYHILFLLQADTSNDTQPASTYTSRSRDPGGNVSNSSNTRRVSTISEQSKTEPAETQRKAAARRARQSRRSTQGVTEDELKEAQMLLHTNTASTTSASSPPVTAAPVSTVAPAGDSEEVTDSCQSCQVHLHQSVCLVSGPAATGRRYHS